MTSGNGAALRRIQLGNALSAFGNGFTVPFVFVYVTQVRGLGSGTAGAVVTAFALAALLVLPLTGRATDRRGPLPVLLAGALAAAAGSAGFGLAQTAPAAIGYAALLGAGVAVSQPALATLIVQCTSPAARPRAFATQFFLANLGLGVGGLLGGQLADTAHPASFTHLFLIDAAMFVILAGVAATVRPPRVHSVVPAASGPAAPTRGGWRAPASDRSMLLLLTVAAVLFFDFYGQFESGLPAFATEVAHIRPATLGAALAANTAVIVAAQYLVLGPIQRSRRSRVIAAVGLLWAAAWAAIGAAGLAHRYQGWATAVFVSTYALFGLGEAMLSPTLAPLVADLAPSHLVGRYNSAFALVKQMAMAVGPAVGGALAGAGWYGPYIVLMIVCSLAVGVLALRLGARLTAGQDRPVPRPAVPAPEAEPEPLPVAC